jgi:L-asparaginase/Glu-tRNA(Gln) amidotransferase subunit D
MNKILLIFTGGTIGSVSVNGTINTDDKARYCLLELFREQYARHACVEFEVRQPVQILSENLQPVVWGRLINAIEAEDLNGYAGVIVLHGTDTLAYTATALAMYFNHLSIPLLLVSSNYPLQNTEANGMPNFICAVDYILQRQQPGVFVPYKNPGQEQVVHIATRLASSLQLSGDFVSVQGLVYMRYRDGGFLPGTKMTLPEAEKVSLNADFGSNVLLLRPYPGMNYQAINLDGVDAVLHDLYHSGTACISDDYGEQYSLLEFASTCRQRNVPLYLAPAVRHADYYDTTRVLMESGVEMIWNMSLEAAYVKLLLAMGNYTDRFEISAFLQQDIAWEHVSCNT